jgi:hypothetical protein
MNEDQIKEIKKKEITSAKPAAAPGKADAGKKKK